MDQTCIVLNDNEFALLNEDFNNTWTEKLEMKKHV